MPFLGAKFGAKLRNIAKYRQIPANSGQEVLLAALAGVRCTRSPTVWAVPTSAAGGIVGVSYVSNCLSWVRNSASN